MTDNLTIGHVARRVGITPKTVRYYETIGLLPEVDRAPNGYRCFRHEDVDRLEFIRRAKSLGLNLDEIRALTMVAEQGECQRITAELQHIVSAKIRECNERIESLISHRDSLESVSQKLGGHMHHHHGGHGSGHPAFSPNCTCLPDPT